jgi:hypothetical protein
MVDKVDTMAASMEEINSRLNNGSPSLVRTKRLEHPIRHQPSLWVEVEELLR